MNVPAPLYYCLLLQLALIFSSIASVNSKCYQYEKGDQFPEFNSSYCVNIIKWPVSDKVFNTVEQRDKAALDNYTNLYEDYYQQGHVSLDCLGIAKYFFCAKAFPTCVSGDEDANTKIQSMCRWMCDLFSVRCGEENNFYQDICVKSIVADQTCSFEYKLAGMGSFLLLILIIIT